jgi:serine/threonine protein kinase
MTHIKNTAAKDAITDMNSELKGVSWDKICPTASKEALDLISKMLRFDPDERISAAEALKHNYLKEYHDYIEEDYPDIDKKFYQDFEDPNMDENSLR